MNKFVSWLLRILYSRVIPSPVRSGLRLQLELLRRNGVPRPVEISRGGKVLVLAPHMDDEVFGCGGTLALLTKTGSQVSVVYLTDGSKGYDAGKFSHETAEETRQRETKLVQTRRQEAERAKAVLGLREVIFLDLPDGSLRVNKDSVLRLANVLRQVKPDTLYLPFLTDPHPDHWMTNCLLIEAAAHSDISEEVQCWGYEIWAPVLANAVVDITSVVDQKRQAMTIFASQIADMNYPRVVLGLNTYRALFTQRGSGFAEAFYIAELSVYRKIYSAAVMGRPSLRTIYNRSSSKKETELARGQSSCGPRDSSVRR